MRQLLRTLLLFSPTLALLGIGGWYVVAHLDDELPPDAPRPGGRLVVVVVFDQMRGDYLTRWPGLFDTAGFEKVKRDGVWYSNARLPYGCSATGPGHASIGTGAPPAVHGIVENTWYDRRTGRGVYCASDAGFSRIPRPTADSKETGGLSPARLLVPGVAARLKAVEGANARVFSLSLKDRAAVLMAGRCPDAGVYCFDSAVGHFHTSSYYRTDLPEWVSRFNKTRDTSPADVWFSQRWDRLLPTERYAGRDDVESEGRGVNGMGHTFPHPLKGKLPDPAKGFYDAVETSPFGNQLLWEFAKECLTAEGLGRRGTKDLLYLSFSSNDLIGHAWGPDSHEVQDVTARSDRLLADVIRHLDETVGRENYTLVVTADHGVCPLPELTPGAERFEPAAELARLAEALDHTFGPLGGKPGSPDLWLRTVNYPDLYVSDALLAEEGKSRADVERYIAEWVGHRPHMLAALPRSLLAGPPLTDPLARRVQLGWHPDRSGDVVMVHQPYLLPGKNTGGYSVAGHGSPHDYDTHVPLMAFGAGVPMLGARPEPTSSLAVAAIVCRALGIDPPAEAKEPLPAGWEK